MLNIRQVKHLAHRLDVPRERLVEIAESAQSWCEELLLNDPAKPDKQRTVLNVFGPLRKMQARMLRGVLLPKLSVTEFNHGGVRGRHIKTNVEPHLKSTYVYTTDISNFYPAVSHNRVYRLFSRDFGCSPDVARICTKICTYEHHLALGLITSPILADQVMRRIDSRVGGACHKAGLVYTRYVDDLTISGPFDLQKSGFAALVERILGEHGFDVNPSKNRFGRLADGVPITKIRVNRGHPDVRREYLDELERQIADADSNERRRAPKYGTPVDIAPALAEVHDRLYSMGAVADAARMAADVKVRLQPRSTIADLGRAAAELHARLQPRSAAADLARAAAEIEMRLRSMGGIADIARQEARMRAAMPSIAEIARQEARMRVAMPSIAEIARQEARMRAAMPSIPEIARQTARMQAAMPSGAEIARYAATIQAEMSSIRDVARQAAELESRFHSKNRISEILAPLGSGVHWQSFDKQVAEFAGLPMEATATAIDEENLRFVWQDPGFSTLPTYEQINRLM